MYQNVKNITQIVRIDTIDINKNEVHCSGKDGGRFILKIPVSNGFYRIPKSGEHWIVRRNNSTTWYFEGIFLQENVYGSAYPKAGDSVIVTNGDLNISSDHVFLNNYPIGVLEHEEFDLDSAVSEILLSYVPVSETIQVFNNGLLIAPSQTVIREKTVLFNNPLSVGKVVIYYTRMPTK